MPADSFTVEFWARGGEAGKESQRSSNLFSYATESVGQGKWLNNGSCILSCKTPVTNFEIGRKPSITS